MNSEMPGMPELSDRMEKLEKENGRLKLAGVLMFLGAVLASRYLPGRKAIEAQYISLRDEDGKQRVLINDNTVAAGVNVFDNNEKLQAALSIEGKEPKLTIFDSNEKKRIAIGMMDDGPALIFENAGEKPTLMLVQRQEVGAFALLDPEGKLIWSEPAVQKAREKEKR